MPIIFYMKRWMNQSYWGFLINVVLAAKQIQNYSSDKVLKRGFEILFICDFQSLMPIKYCLLRGEGAGSEFSASLNCLFDV